MEKNTWDNLKRIFVFFRFDIKNKYNYQVAGVVIDTINNSISNEKMCKMILRIMPEWKEQLAIAENEDDKFFFPSELDDYIVNALEMFGQTILEHNYEMAYDLADILQGLPDTFSKKRKELKKYWKVYVRPFQKKWHSNIFENQKHLFK